MVVDSGETQVLKRQVAHLLHRRVDVNLAGLDLLQQLSEMFGLYESPPGYLLIVYAALRRLAHEATRTTFSVQ